jgi:hypothetical protein
MNIDEIDVKILNENFDSELIQKMDKNNVSYIFKYLLDNGVYYAKDLFLSSLDLFLLPYQQFIDQFEKLKQKLGPDYVDKLGEDMSLIELMYKN